jgi:hypothetical protein
VANVLSVFVSSSCYELRDLRASIKDFLRSMEINPQLSEDAGFPRTAGDKPYVTCLRTLADCPLVIGILERRCGHPCADWSPFSEYNGLRPTHAELRHTLKTNKKLILYVHESTISAYHMWQADRVGYAALAGDNRPDGPTLELFHELVTHDPAPFYESFKNASDVLNSLKRNLLNEIYASLMDQEARNRNHAEYLMEKILTAAPEIRTKIQDQLNPGLITDLENLKAERNELEIKVTNSEQQSQASFEALKTEKESLDKRIEELEKETKAAQIMLTMAATRDVRWLEHVRMTLMPKQPCRVPFHNSAEVAIRGYHAAGGNGVVPHLREVTWSKLPYTERDLHRGYKAGIILRGGNFIPGVTYAYRRVGDLGPPTGNGDYFWHLPNIYFGDYLEVSASDDEVESPLSWRSYEFQVKNPEGRTSAWVEFSYPFNDEFLLKNLRESAEEGRRHVSLGNYKAAIEPLRKAMVFADRIFGVDAPETVTLRAEYNKALDDSVLSKLRFHVGNVVEIISGEHAGKSGIIDSLGLRQTRPYWVDAGKGEMIAVADDEVELLGK